MSAGGFDGGIAGVWGVIGVEGNFGNGSVGITGGVRPSISLKPSTNVTGEGTSEDPYVVD